MAVVHQHKSDIRHCSNEEKKMNEPPITLWINYVNFNSHFLVVTKHQHVEKQKKKICIMVSFSTEK